MKVYARDDILRMKIYKRLHCGGGEITAGGFHHSDNF